MCAKCASVVRVPTPTLSEREERPMKKTIFRCPVADFDCPYCDLDGYCSLENAVEECDDAAACADDDCYPITVEDEAVE